ncbi:AcrR family transcriptional regulator [Caldalkalibacillus uzonensis]|uniref:AcrR family transcriptional regulator n=1 Tax=Caldalkalibacillus uzonensis TaxID=353224 RepID=A0ABU0CLE3_9BACI|nr:TetR/AcrR family transcriptional regulator [Caldalkalibacillus uzonensis]MDQ0337236.1 AcrR family transcriptional regulator [Caldalkalibacillus uzonensis]
MRKGDITREMIIKKTVPLFNRYGYFGSSVSDIMAATGLKKGGIYNHFKSKDELALKAFDYAVEEMSRHYAQALQGKTTVLEQIEALFSVYEDIENPPIEGGCPLLNTAIESDDAHQVLLKRVQQAMDRWLSLIRYILLRGIKRKELRPDLEVEEIASFITSSFEGAIMLSKLYNDSSHLQRTKRQVIEHIKNYLIL